MNAPKTSPRSAVRSSKLWNIFHGKFPMENSGHRAPRIANLKLNDKGATMIELMIVVGIIAFVMSLLTLLSYTGVTAWQKQSARVKLEAEAQNFMYVLSYKLRQAQPGTVSISRFPGETQPNSMITFTMVGQSSPVSCFLRTLTGPGGKIMHRQVVLLEPVFLTPVASPVYGGSGNILATDVVSLYFTYPKISDNTRVLVSIAVERVPFKKKVPVSYQAQEIIYIRN